MNKVILGVDTSNYRTSLCLMDVDGNVVAEERMLLTVKPGERGLQQSEALFQHIQRLPQLAEKMAWAGYQVAAVIASTRPRPVDGSYMPV
ncbi:hypothetical protein U6N72_12930, partial [Cutibacterium acnes]